MYFRLNVSIWHGSKWHSKLARMLTRKWSVLYAQRGIYLMYEEMLGENRIELS